MRGQPIAGGIASWLGAVRDQHDDIRLTAQDVVGVVLVPHEAAGAMRDVGVVEPGHVDGGAPPEERRGPGIIHRDHGVRRRAAGNEPPQGDVRALEPLRVRDGVPAQPPRIRPCHQPQDTDGSRERRGPAELARRARCVSDEGDDHARDRQDRHQEPVIPDRRAPRPDVERVAAGDQRDEQGDRVACSRCDPRPAHGEECRENPGAAVESEIGGTHDPREELIRVTAPLRVEGVGHPVPVVVVPPSEVHRDDDACDGEPGRRVAGGP